MSMLNFNAEIFVSSEMEKQLVNMSMDLGMRIVTECAKVYGFDANEAIRNLNLGSLTVSKKAVTKGVKKAKAVKSSFPMPFNGVAIEGCCGGLRANRGLYTQCQGKPASESGFCKGCQDQADKNGNGKPDCGTIADRLAVGLYEFKDPKGKSPIAFTALLKKLKLSEEAVKEEAGKLNITIVPEHFEFIALEKKKGRKSSEKKEKVVKEKKEKGRPKKSKKVLELEGDSSDLFASLVAQANAVSESESNSESEDDSDEIIIEKNDDKEAKRQAKEAAKLAEKEAKRQAVEAEKEAKRLAVEAEKEAKRKAAEEEKAKKELAKLEEKESKRLAAEAEKEAKRLAAEAEKKAKEEAKLQKKESSKKESPKKESSKKEEPKAKENDEPDVVKRIEYEGKKYLKSKKTGIVYNLEQDVVGKWNEDTQKIEFYENNSDEEEEEGYESD